MVKPKESVSWSTFTDVFDKQFWLVYILLLFGLTGVLYIAFKFSEVSASMFDSLNGSIKCSLICLNTID
jgi:hypothetical protein